MKETHWTARDFVKTAVEFARMTPDRGSWSEQSLGSNPPRLVRLQRLRVFAKVFDVQPGFEALWSGDFIARRPIERYEPLRQHILRDSELQFPDVPRTARGPLGFGEVAWIYKRLFQFLAEHAYPMLDFNSGVLTASGFYLYTLLRVQRTISVVPQSIRPIEDVVALVVEPEGRSFTERELTEHGWPEGSLIDIDTDWA